MSTPELNKLSYELERRLHRALDEDNKTDQIFYYKIRAMLEGLKIFFGPRHVEMVLAGTLNLDKTPKEITELDRKTPVV